MKKKVTDAGLSDLFYIESAATSREEIWNGIGNPVYPPAKAKLAENGISCEGKAARQTVKSDYSRFDYILAMDNNNLRNMNRIYGADPEKKISLLMDFTSRRGEAADPWYTGNFDATWRDVNEGCDGFLSWLSTQGKI